MTSTTLAVSRERSLTFLGWPRLPATAGVALLLALVAVVPHWQLLTTEYVLVPADLLFSMPAFQSVSPPGFVQPANALLSDVVFQFYPWSLVTREALRSGSLPFWNQYVLSGAPHLANFQSAVLYPLNVVGYLLPLNLAINFGALGRLIIAATGMVLFSRELRLGLFGMVVAGATFTLGGSMTVWLSYPISNCYAWMPMLFFLGERLVRTKQLRYFPALVAVLATVLLAGQPQVAFIVLLAWFVYCAARIATVSRMVGNRRAAITSATLVLTALAASVLVAAIQLLPSWEWLQLTSEASRRASISHANVVDPAFVRSALTAGVSLLLPNFFGNPATSGNVPLSFLYSNYLEQTLYLGIAPLTFAIMAVVSVVLNWHTHGPAWVRDENRLVMTFGGMAVLFLALAVYTPGVDLLTRLPVFDLVWAQRYRLAFSFCGAVLAGIGAHRLARADLNRSGAIASAHWLVGMSIVCACALVAVGVGLRVFQAQVNAIPRWHGLYEVMLNAFSVTNAQMYAPVVVALCLAILMYTRAQHGIGHRFFQFGATGLVVADLLVFAWGFNPATPTSEVFPATSQTRFLNDRLGSGSGRVLALDNALPADAATPYGLRDVSGYDVPLEWYADLVQGMGGLVDDGHRIVFSTLDRNVLQVFDVSYVISTAAPQGPGAVALQEVASDGIVHVFENRAPLPRAHVVHDVHVEADLTRSLDLLKSTEFQASKTVLLHEAPPHAVNDLNERAGDQVTVTADRGSEVQMTTTTRTAGYLVLSDTFYPGWHAEVDGIATPIYRANVAFRAIYLPEGSHVVRFVYTPTWFGLGLTLSIIGILLTAAIPLGIRVRGRFRKVAVHG